MDGSTLSTKIKNKRLQLHIDLSDKELLGKKATLKYIVKTQVKDSRAVNSKKEIHKQHFIIESLQEVKEIHLSEFQAYSYKGKQLDIELLCQLVIDDSLFFDTKITEKIELELNIKPKVSNNAKSIIQPKDLFDFFKNLKAIPLQNKIQVFGLAIVGGIVMLINTLVGAHDQFVSESQTYFYSHTNSDGESSSPLVNALVGSGALGAGIWFLMKKQLRKYMKFHFQRFSFPSSKDAQIKVSELLTGKSLVDLENTRLRIVAANIEKGQYTRGSGTKKRTVSFSNPVRGVVLFNKKLGLIPKKENISGFLSGEFSFEDMYHTLYPELHISSSHGLFVHWEVQLIHDTFIDQELIGPKHFLEYNNFLNDK